MDTERLARFFFARFEGGAPNRPVLTPRPDPELMHVDDQMGDLRRTDPSRMLARLLGNLPGVAYRCRNDERWTAEFFSDAVFALTGYAAAEFNEHRRCFGDLIHPEDRDQVDSQIQNAINARARFSLDYRIVTASREVRWVSEQGCGVFDASGRLEAVEGFVTDITDRRLSEETLRENAVRLESLISATPVAVWEEDFSGVLAIVKSVGLFGRDEAFIRQYISHHPDLLEQVVARVRIIDVNQEALRLHHAQTKAELLAGLDRLIVPDSSNALIKQVVAVAQGATTFETYSKVRTLDGEQRDVKMRWTVAPGYESSLNRVIRSTSDITELRRNEATMRLQSSALNAAANAIMITDRAGRIQWVNPAWNLLTGYSSAEAMGRTPRLLKSGAQDASFYQGFWATILAGKSVEGEVINRRKDGGLYHEYETITPVVDEQGEVTHFIAIKQDITERKRVEADRERESSLLSSTLRSLPGIFYLFDSENRLRRWNANFEKETGYDAGELAGRGPMDFVAPADRALTAERIRTALAEGAADLEAHLLAKDGSLTPYVFTGVGVDLEGKRHLVGVGINIANRRRSEELVRQLNRTYSVLSDINQLIVRAKTAREVLDGACETAVKRGGFSLAWINLSEARGADLRLAAYASAAGDELEVATSSMPESEEGCVYPTRAFASGSPSVCNDIEHAPLTPWRDAAIRRGYRAMASFPFSISGHRAGTFNLYAAHTGFFDPEEVVLLVKLVDDIGFGLEFHQRESLRVAAEAALRESEARFRTVLEKVALIGLMLDCTGRVILCSDHLLTLTGWTREEVVGSDWFETFLPASERDRIRSDVFLSAINTGQLLRHFENEIVTRQGEHRLIAWSNSLVRDSDNQIVAVASLGEDITERKRAEQQIRKLASFPRLNPNPVLEFSSEGEMLYANPAAQAMAQQIGVENIASLLPPGTRDIVRNCLATSLARLRVLSERLGHTISWSFHPITSEQTVHCYAGDITERFALEEQLRHSQKMDAIGQLAGGVAHDFNNLLTIIQGNTAILETEELSPTERTEVLAQISGAARRAAALTRQLLTFSRRQVMQLRDVDLNEIVTAIGGMLRRLIGANVRLEMTLQPQIAPIRGDPDMLDQIIVNLAINARDAMPTGGLLTLTTDTVFLSADELEQSPDAAPGAYVRLTVSDTGLGIAPEILPRIFEPFFTTKAEGKGTGLGLATVFGIVKQHNGILRVSSEVAKGTTFAILLPATTCGV